MVEMPKMVYTEYKSVENPIVEWLHELGWRYISSLDLPRDAEEPFDIQVLTDAIRRLNIGIVRTEEEIERIINRLRRFSNDITGNREFFNWIKGEGSLVLRQGEKSQTIKLIDYDNMENNRFVVSNQYKFTGYERVRFDIVLMVNGIPLVVLEAKAPTREMVDYHEAINQLLRYHRVAPQLFKYLAFVCATDGVNFKYDWINDKKYFEWRQEGFVDPLEASIRGIFQRDRFLDIIGNFIVFEKEGEEIRKKIAMYQQVLASNKIIDRILEGKGKTGLIWHTQGSGKTLTMLFSAWKLKKIPRLNNPTIILIVDRIDLQRQMHGAFVNVDMPYTTKAQSKRNLINKLRKDSREVIITTMQKFGGVEEVLSDRENIIVFIDEAHRTQYGKLAIYMRNAFPNASIFGFTGTPIDKSEIGRSTFETFCPPDEKYLDKYSIKQSIEDGATVPLFYLPRLVKYHIDREILDREFLSVTAGLSEEDQESVLKKSASIRTILEAEDRIDKVARDIGEHFRSHVDPLGFKAQVVAVSRKACALYKEALDCYLPSDWSVVIYTSGQNDEDLLRKYHMPREDQMEIARKPFQKRGENPRLLIVTDMLLTGFDAPIEQVMYLDKPLRDHKLLQAIARTNRPYPNKVGGIIVDYVGIFKNLMRALNFEEEDVRDVAYDFDKLKDQFVATLGTLLDLFTGIKRDESRECFIQCASLLENKKTLKIFKDNLFKLKRIYEIISPDTFLLDYLKDYEWLIEINVIYNKIYQQRTETNLGEYAEKTQELIRKKLVVEKIEKTVPTFKIDKKYFDRLNQVGYTKKEKVIIAIQAIRHVIRIRMETNPIYETLGERVERIIKLRDQTRMLQELQKVVDDITRVEEKAQNLGITETEYAFLNAIRKHVPELKEIELIPFVTALHKEVKGHLFEGWQDKKNVILKIEKIVFDHVMEQFKKLPTKTKIAISEDLMKYLMRHEQ